MKIFCYEIGSGFGEPGGTLTPRIPRGTPHRASLLHSRFWYRQAIAMLRDDTKKGCAADQPTKSLSINDTG